MPDRDRHVLVYEKLRPGLALATALEERGLHPVLPFGSFSCLLREQPLTRQTFIELAAGMPAVLGVSGAVIDREVLRALPDLRFVSKIGIGHDVIDLEAASELGVQVTNTPSPVEIAGVAEHAVALLLSAVKRFDHYNASTLRDGRWLDPDVRPRLVAGHTLGLIGFGRIARAVATRLQTWGMRIVATDLPGRSLTPHAGVEFVSFEQLLAEADFVSVHVSPSAGDPPVLDAAAFALMKPGAILVNTARGAAVDQRALASALASCRLGGAALDVFDPEPPSADEPLLTLPGLVASPHAAAASVQAEEDMEAIAVDNVAQLFDGHVPEFLLNPEARGSDRLRQQVPPSRRAAS